MFLSFYAYIISDYVDGLVQDCSNSSVTIELLQSCAKP